MIGRIKGTVVYLSLDHAIIDVAGVGYIIYCSGKNLAMMKLNSTVILFIETYVREDQISLYGFRTHQEKACFLKLTTVKGIGPKLALQMLGALTVDQIYIGIANRDNRVFAGIAGIGPKIVGRIFTELKADDFVGAEQILASNNNIREDAISALTNLGITKSEAYATVSKIMAQQQDVDLNNLIRLSLSEVSK